MIDDHDRHLAAGRVPGPARGVAAGLLASFGLTAIGGLYEDSLRARALGLFAVMWLDCGRRGGT